MTSITGRNNGAVQNICNTDYQSEQYVDLSTRAKVNEIDIIALKLEYVDLSTRAKVNEIDIIALKLETAGDEDELVELIAK